MTGSEVNGEGRSWCAGGAWRVGRKWCLVVLRSVQPGKCGRNRGRPDPKTPMGLAGITDRRRTLSDIITDTTVFANPACPSCFSFLHHCSRLPGLAAARHHCSLRARARMHHLAAFVTLPSPGSSRPDLHSQSQSLSRAVVRKLTNSSHMIFDGIPTRP
jgi:hypothetical protein